MVDFFVKQSKNDGAFNLFPFAMQRLNLYWFWLKPFLYVLCGGFQIHFIHYIIVVGMVALARMNKWTQKKIYFARYVRRNQQHY